MDELLTQREGATEGGDDVWRDEGREEAGQVELRGVERKGEEPSVESSGADRGRRKGEEPSVES